MRVTICGYGRWGRNITRVLQEVPRVTDIHVVDVSREARLSCQSDWPDLEVCDEIPWMMTDAVVLPVPAAQQPALVVEALAKGKHVLCEKPGGARRDWLKDLVVPDGLTLMFGYVYCYHPYFRLIRQQLADGVYGQSRMIVAQRGSLGPTPRRDLSALEDYACHDIAMACRLFGHPRCVEGSFGTWLMPGNPDTVDVNCDWADGTKLFAMCSWQWPVKVREWMIIGDKRMGVWNDMLPERRLALYDSGYNDIVPWSGAVNYPQPFCPRWQEPLWLELKAFVDSCLGDEAANLTGIELARDVWSVMDRLKARGI